MSKVGNWIGENTSTQGTGALTLIGAIDQHTTFAQAGVGPGVWYVIINGTKKEAGFGTLTGNSLARTTIHATLVNGFYDNTSPAPINLSGTSTVFCTFNARAFGEFDEGMDKLASISEGATPDQTASEVPYDNAQSGISSTDVQSAIDEVQDIAVGSLQIGDNISLLNNDYEFISHAPSDGKQYGSKDGMWVEISSSFSGSYNDLTDVPSTFAPSPHTHTKSEITDFNESDYATSAQGAKADSSIQPTANISLLTNDAGYLTSVDTFSGSYNDLSDVPTEFVPTTHTHVESEITDLDKYTKAEVDAKESSLQASIGTKADSLHTHIKSDITDFNESDYATSTQGAKADSALQTGDNVSELINDADYIKANNVNLTNLDAPLFQGFQPNKLTTVSAPSGTDSDVTHTRASTATYIDRYGVLKTAGIDELRETADGYQIEAIGSTNSLLWSEEFNQSGVWGLSSASVTANQAISPDGNMAADLLSPDGADCTIFQSIASTPNTKTFSVWLKATTPIPVNMNILFSTSSKSIIVSDKWERFDISSEDVNDVAVFIGGVGQWSDGEDIYAWGAQLEEGNLSSYIPTTDAPATRAPDIVSMPYENNVPRGDQPYTIIFKGIIDGYVNFNRLFATDSDDVNSRVYSFITSLGGIYHSNGSDNSRVKTNNITFGEEFTYVITSDGVNYTSYLDGVLQATSPVTSPATELPNEMRISQGHIGGYGSNGKCSLFKTLPYAITADEAKLIS